MPPFNHTGEALEPETGASSHVQLVNAALVASRHLDDPAERKAFVDGYLTARGLGRDDLDDLFDALIATIFFNIGEHEGVVP